MVGPVSALESKARSFRGVRRKRRGRPSPAVRLEQEIALMSERLDLQRVAHQERLRGVLREECAIDTNLMAIVSYNPLIYRMHGRSRDKLKDRLARLSSERRRMSVEHDRVMADLHDRVFKILGRHELLGSNA